MWMTDQTHESPHQDSRKAHIPFTLLTFDSLVLVSHYILKVPEQLFKTYLMLGLHQTIFTVPD